MSQPQQPPGWGAPPQQPPQPQPPKKSKTGKTLGFGCLGAVALIVVIAAIGAATGGDSKDSTSSDKAATPNDKPKSGDAKKDPPAEDKGSQADQFKACVAKGGSGSEKAAVKHVTKVTGADKKNDILDAAEVFTDFTGGVVGPHASDGKLVASAFGSCYESENGLVTVYDKGGEILSNGNY
ncbi:hypothetical protein AB0I94_32010 [Streptomyces sp. NPDC050147]|uniref:hypothetical protein n=1 Tax=Streptomyces sp. NPDC050147 TaxID=3155513 RepID=UPI003439B3C2